MNNIIVKIVAFGMLFLATLTLVSPTAQARKFGMVANYKYLLGLHRHQDNLGTRTDSTGHGAQIDFMWSLDGDKGRRSIPSHALGFSVAGGGLTDHIVRDEGPPQRILDRQGGFYRMSVFYEFVFDNGLGLSAGLGGGHIIGKQEYGALGFTDLGLKYHMKNGLVFSLTTDIMVDPASFSNAYARYLDEQRPPDSQEESLSMFTSNYYAFVLGVATGIGYYF